MRVEGMSYTVRVAHSGGSTILLTKTNFAILSNVTVVLASIKGENVAIFTYLNSLR